LGLGVVVWNIQVALALIFCGFAASSLVKWFYYKVIRKREPILPALEQVTE
jgi:formate-dependent nitrite reductase membrane component NrfD